GRLRRAGPINWSLLVNGANLHDRAADELLRRFDFVPQARLDDVMASLAAPGGGVGPHYDSYDVFLLQAVGRRVWRLCRPRRYTVLANSPLRLIEDFVAEDEYLVEPGDLLYLPPGWGHDGVALEPSLAYSVGFRAPDAGELASALLDRLHEHRLPQRRYRDPLRGPSRNSARIPDAMLEFALDALARLRWSSHEVAQVLGEHLTMPKQQVVFKAPVRRLTLENFRQRLLRSEVVLDPKTQLLYFGASFFINGDRCVPRERQRKTLARFADRRRLAGTILAAAALTPLLHEWHGVGYLHLERA
ncbi:MAG: cupin domain-containing protein, partial [Betaproteobacteria bacterium]|nr:cupin domain-containing protein [Betaproteobacteria bacterium]